jgi:hypothetical protein
MLAPPAISPGRSRRRLPVESGFDPIALISMALAVLAVVWLVVGAVRGHSRANSDLSVKASVRDRYDAEHPDRPRRLGEHPRGPHGGRPRSGSSDT